MTMMTRTATMTQILTPRQPRELRIQNANSSETRNSRNTSTRDQHFPSDYFLRSLIIIIL